ncbi:hypothetical protein niasHS_004694 [Heterodera schachtii]|uniref:Integrase catalytic domain-containing protein n=1 Tax=Heterodera schachtii TaxID=97005 RepID=A0ABD2JWV7_HETSC
MLTSPQFHAGMAERANRSIKERLYRYFTERGTYKWIEVVQDIVKGINYSINSSIGMRPADVNFGNAEELRQKLYNEAKKMPKMSPKFKVGDRVTRQIHSGFVYHENYNSTPNGKLDSLLLYILILGLRLVLLNNNLSKLNGKQEIRGPDLDVLEEMIRAKLNEEIKNMVEEDRTILDATKEMGMEAWVQAYRKHQCYASSQFEENLMK